MEIASMINGAIGEMVWAAEQYSSRDRHADVTIDITYVACSGNRDEFQVSTGAPPSKSYSSCDKMAIISIGGEEVKFTFGMRPLRGYIPRSVLVEQLLEIASEHVSLRTVSSDAEFDGSGVIDALEEQNLSYLIRKSSDNRVDRFVADMDHDVAVKHSHEMEKIRGSLNPERGYNGGIRDEPPSEWRHERSTRAYPPHHGAGRPQVGNREQLQVD